MKKIFPLLVGLVISLPLPGFGDASLAAPPADAFLTLTRTAVVKDRLPTNTQVISSKDIQDSGAQNIGDVLDKETSLHIVRTTGLGSLTQATVRGFSSSRVLILVDGRPIRNLFVGTIDLSQIPVDGVDRIEVVRGPGSALYGQNATGGVINIISKRATAAPSAALTTQFGSYGTQIYRAEGGGKQGPVDVYLSGSRNRQDGFRQNSDFANWSTDGIIGFEKEGFGRTELQGIFTQSDLGVPGALSLPPSSYNGVLENAASSPDDRQGDRDRALSLTHNMPLGSDVRLVTHLFWDQRDQNFKNVFFGSNFFTVSHAVDRKAEVQGHLPAGFVLGAEFEDERYTDNFSARLNTNIWSGYAEQTQEWAERWTTVLGLRGDRDLRYGGSVNPRATVVFQAAPNLKLSTNVGRAFRAPTFADLFTPASNPNANLRPETTWSWDVGAEWHPIERIRGRLTLFHTWTKDRIVSDSGSNFRSENLARARTKGIESTITHVLCGPLQDGIDYTFTEARGQRDGFEYQDIPLVPRHKLAYFLEWAPMDGLSARSSMQYFSRQYFPNFDGSDRTVLPDVFLWNIRLAYRTKGAELFFLVENLLQRRYALNANPPEFGGGYYPQSGRTLSGGITVHFGEQGLAKTAKG